MTDSRLTADLALLGRIAHERLPSVDASLKRFEAASTGSERIAVSLARTFIQRVGRIAAGATAIVGVAGTLARISVNTPSGHREPTLFERLLEGPQLWVAVVLLGASAIAYGIATTIAARQIERTLHVGGVPAAQRLVDRVERWDIGLTIAGVLTPVLFFGMMRVVLGNQELDTFLHRQAPPELSLPFSSTSYMLGGAFLATWLGAFVVARLPSTTRSSRGAIVVAAIVFFGTLWAGATFDSGPVVAEFYRSPSVPLRTALTVTGTLSLFVLVSELVLARRRR